MKLKLSPRHHTKLLPRRDTLHGYQEGTQGYRPLEDSVGVTLCEEMHDTYTMLRKIGIGEKKVELVGDIEVKEWNDQEDVPLEEDECERLTLNPGPQTAAGACPADILIYGGAAGGGKSHFLLLDPTRGLGVPGFSATIFRRTCPQITRAGSILDKATLLYTKLGARLNRSDMLFVFPGGGKIQFSHMQHEQNQQDWQGTELAYAGFDELTHFEASQFWYIVSRNRSTSGFKPCIRATCNPEPDSWVYHLIEWWIDQTTGTFIPERSGVVRWFVRLDDTIVWGDTQEELQAAYPENIPISLSFIGAKLDDNQPLVKADPKYRANLQAMPAFERQILLEGNWKVRRSAGMRFKRHWFEIVDVMPGDVVRTVRYWDRASTEKTSANPDPDRTAGVKVSKLRNGDFVVSDVCTLMGTPLAVRAAIRNCCTQDVAEGCELWLEQDPAQAGVAEAADLARDLQEWAPRFMRPTGSKWMRSANASAAAEAGRVKILRGKWNDAFLDELEAFCDEKTLEVGQKMPHDDRVDGFSGATNVLITLGSPGVY